MQFGDALFVVGLDPDVGRDEEVRVRQKSPNAGKPVQRPCCRVEHSRELTWLANLAGQAVMADRSPGCAHVADPWPAARNQTPPGSCTVPLVMAVDAELAHEGPDHESRAGRATTSGPETSRLAATASTIRAAAAPSPRALIGAGVGNLQRTIGNRGVRRILGQQSIQRDTPKAAPTAPATAPAAPVEWTGGAIPADMITASPPAVPSMSGTTTATVAGELATVTGPKATMADVTFGLDSKKYAMAEKALIEGGFVQTVKRSERIAAYESPPAKAGGDPVQFEQNVGTTGAHRDVTQVRNEAGGQPFAAAQAPFFLRTEVISKANPGGTVPGTAPGASGFDQPSMLVETKIGTGKLVAVHGREDFQTSFAVKDKAGPTGSLTHLSKSAWGFAWDVPGLASLTPGDKASGKAGASGASGEAPSVVDGPTAKDAAHQYLVFTSTDSAMTQSAAVLFDNLPKAGAAGDQDTVNFTQAALKAKNPKFSITVTCKTTNDWVGRDSVRFYVGKTKADVRTKLKAGETATIEFNLNDLVEGRVDGAEAHIGVDLGGDKLETTYWRLMQPKFFESMKVGTGVYDVAGKLSS